MVYMQESLRTEPGTLKIRTGLLHYGGDTRAGLLPVPGAHGVYFGHALFIILPTFLLVIIWILLSPKAQPFLVWEAGMEGECSQEPQVIKYHMLE